MAIVFRIVWYFTNMLMCIYFGMKLFASCVCVCTCVYVCLRMFANHTYIYWFLFYSVAIALFAKSLSLNMLTVNTKWYMIQTQTNEKWCKDPTRQKGLPKWKMKYHGIFARQRRNEWKKQRITFTQTHRKTEDAAKFSFHWYKQ